LITDGGRGGLGNYQKNSSTTKTAEKYNRARRTQAGASTIQVPFFDLKKKIGTSYCPPKENRAQFKGQKKN